MTREHRHPTTPSRKLRLGLPALAQALAPALALALAQAPAAAKSSSTKSKPAREPDRPVTVTLESVDRAAARAIVRITGCSKAPDARLFSFHDDRDRHFIALGASCAPATAPAGEGVVQGAAGEKRSDELRCLLALPAAYMSRAHVERLTLRTRGRDVRADETVVRALFEAAPLPPPPGPRMPVQAQKPPVGQDPDGGVMPEDERDDDAEEPSATAD